METMIICKVKIEREESVMCVNLVGATIVFCRQVRGRADNRCALSAMHLSLKNANLTFINSAWISRGSGALKNCWNDLFGYGGGDGRRHKVRKGDPCSDFEAPSDSIEPTFTKPFLLESMRCAAGK